MRGIETSRRWYEAYGAPMLEREFADKLPRIAVGLAGRGSECFGFDDEISRDHDFHIRFLLWVTEEDEREFGFRLARAYFRLRKEFPPDGPTAESALGDAEQGVTVIGDFYRRHLGFPGVPENWRQWLYTPEYAFAEATNGAVFRDDAGVFTGIRNSLLHDMPEDVRKKKIAARAVQMAQCGQYDFGRCLKHGEPGAAALFLADFVRAAGSMIFLLNRRFMPYAKWMFRAMRQLEKLSDMTDPLEFLLTQEAAAATKAEIIEDICLAVARELAAQELSDAEGAYLEPHAFAVMKTIRSRELRELHVMEG